VFRKHQLAVTSVAFSPDGQRLVSGQATLVRRVKSSSGMPPRAGRPRISETWRRRDECGLPQRWGGIASTGARRDPLPAEVDGEVKVWNARTGEEPLLAAAKWGAPGAWPSARRPASRLSQQRRIGELP